MTPLRFALRSAVWKILPAIVLLASSIAAAGDPDLTVGWISRSPSMDYVWDSPHPDRDGWPAIGSTVTWVAHVRNWKATPRHGLVYHWLLDGSPLATGKTDLPANAYASIELPWTWTFERHVLTLAIAGNGEPSLSVFTDAVSVGFYVEQTYYDFMRQHQPELGIGSTGFEDWAERHIARFNEMAPLAIYPETPQGVLDRQRLDEIVIVPDGALPLTPLPDYGTRDGQPNEETHPNKADLSVDMQWGFPAKDVRFFNDFKTVGDDNPFFLTDSLVHELGHARYLVDVYGWNVWTGESDGSTVAIKEGGRLVAGTSLMPLSGNYVYFTPEQGLMNQDYSFFDRMSANALNQIAGHRAIEGNSNDPDNEGSFLNDLPAENRVTVRLPTGTPIPDADVRIYQATGVPGHFITKYYDDTPDLVLKTDANGQVLVGRCPFAADGKIVHTFGASNVTAIVRVAGFGVVRYGFLESQLFNFAYWDGHHDFADYDLTVGAPLCFPSRPALQFPEPESVVQGPLVTFTWSYGFDDAVGYRLWVSIDGAPATMVAETDRKTKSAEAPASGRVAWWVEILHSACPVSRSATGFFNVPPDGTSTRLDLADPSPRTRRRAPVSAEISPGACSNS